MPEEAVGTSKRLTAVHQQRPPDIFGLLASWHRVWILAINERCSLPSDAARRLTATELPIGADASAAIGQYRTPQGGGEVTSGEPFVLQPGAGRSIDVGGFLVTVKATAESTGNAFTLLEAEEPAHFGPPMHIHRDAAEAFYILDGEYLIFMDDRELRCPAGSFVYIPPGAVHGFRVRGQPSKKLNLYASQAMIGYFDELAAAIAAREVDDERLGAIAERYGMEVANVVMGRSTQPGCSRPATSHTNPVNRVSDGSLAPLLAAVASRKK
jgi:mannose-6-phosphate isomerase-like protein (cupin superfamily)